MDKEFEDRLKKESMYLLGLLLAFMLVLKIVFHKEGFSVIIRTALSFFWLLVLPAFSIMYYWKKYLSFGERFIISIPLNAAVTGILSYNLGLIGLHSRYHGIVIPVVMLAVGTLIILKKK
ncbi:hypothetical protein JXA85_04755 [Candidatus Woesearchaeota archaeon]|nr:hypothetical protein [Candidatus Woesearchaeota archaeon]